MAAIERHGSPSPAPLSRGDAATLWNVPNTLSGLRLVGAIALIFLSLFANSRVVGVVFALLVATDWVDGKLAILLRQQTKFGARLDSIADSSLYGALLFAYCWLKGDFIAGHWPGIVIAMASYSASVLYSFYKFQCLPSYHTYAAKFAWHSLNLAVFLLFMGWATWPFDATMAVAALVNLEAIAITRKLRECRVNVGSFWLLPADK